MSFALQPTSLIPIKVVGDWSGADAAATDVANALEASFPGVFVFPMADNLTLTLIAYDAAGSDKSVLVITAATGAGTWSTAPSTTPAVGTFVYLIDMY